MTNRPPQEDQVRMVIRNLQPKYREHIKFQYIGSFTKLYKVGLLIEEEVEALKSKGVTRTTTLLTRVIITLPAPKVMMSMP